MATIRVVSREFYDKLRELFCDSEVVIVPDDLAEQYNHKDKETVSYSFGGTPDVKVEMAGFNSHLFFDETQVDEDDLMEAIAEEIDKLERESRRRRKK